MLTDKLGRGKPERKEPQYEPDPVKVVSQLVSQHDFPGLRYGVMDGARLRKWEAVNCLPDRLEQLIRPHPQGSCDLHDICQADISFAAFLSRTSRRMSSGFDLERVVTRIEHNFESIKETYLPKYPHILFAYVPVVHAFRKTGIQRIRFSERQGHRNFAEKYRR
jgi:hypothetical protein